MYRQQDIGFIIVGKQRTVRKHVENAVRSESYYSAIHEAAGLMVPGRCITLPGTISETPISRE